MSHPIGNPALVLDQQYVLCTVDARRLEGKFKGYRDGWLVLMWRSGNEALFNPNHIVYISQEVR
jgi:hypothetical protein